MQLFQQIDRVWMNLALWLTSCRKCSEFALPGAIENCLGLMERAEFPVQRKSTLYGFRSVSSRIHFLRDCLFGRITAAHRVAYGKLATDDHCHTAELVAREVSGAQHDLLSLIVLAMRASRSPLPSP